MHLAGKVTSDIIEKINSGIGEMIHQNMVLRLSLAFFCVFSVFGKGLFILVNSQMGIIVMCDD